MKKYRKAGIGSAVAKQIFKYTFTFFIFIQRGNEMTTLLTGIIIGISIAASVGPIGILCIRKTLAYGRSYGLAAGLGAAVADALYGCIAGCRDECIGFRLGNSFIWTELLDGIKR
ncbi:hypothetical protein [Paenibacillus arenosi]|uniref:Major facilitator superfamily (MFS) profile domain-containing protein n=1 Tax=Paenibacillus arenosi TaxID=2774142 RepID=A0ABR9B439_9BACL|nr:hypothetical protein [Paenibacillus arenosi]